MDRLSVFVCLILCLKFVAAALPARLNGPIDESSSQINLRVDAVYRTLEDRRNLTVSILNEMNRCIEPCGIIENVLLIAHKICNKYLNSMGADVKGLAPIAYKLHHRAVCQIETVLRQRGVDEDIVQNTVASLNCRLGRIQCDIDGIVAVSRAQLNRLLAVIECKLRDTHQVACSCPKDFVRMREEALREGEDGNARLLNELTFSVERYFNGVTSEMREIVAAALVENENPQSCY